MKIASLQTLYVEELKDVYDAEHQLLDALAQMSEAAGSTQLKKAFTQHRQETQGQVQRLEQVFRGLGEEPERKTCEGIKGLLEEGKELLDAEGDRDAIDAALIGAAQKVEHYEMAAYGTLRTFALTLGRRDEAQLLQETLDEESAADEKLTDLAVSGVNAEATEGKGNGNGESGGRLAGLLASLGIRSRGGSGSSGGGRSGGGRKSSGGGKSRGAAKPSRSRSAASKGGGKKGGTKSRGTKGRGGASKGGSKAGARKGVARKAGARKTGAAKGGAKKGGARKSGGSKSRSRSR
jgi:ferritin-like metal-binding protein YciE